MFCEISFCAKNFSPVPSPPFWSRSLAQIVTKPTTLETPWDHQTPVGECLTRPPSIRTELFLMHNVLQTNHVSYTATLFDKGVDTVCVPHTRHQPEVLLCHQWGISSLLGLPGRRHTMLVMVLVQWRPHCQEIMKYQRDHQNQKALFFFLYREKKPRSAVVAKVQREKGTIEK